MSELDAFVVVPQCDVPAGKMPAAAVALVGRALGMGLTVRSTYAVALMPGVMRKVAGFVRDESGEGGKAKGGAMEPRTVMRETVAVRVREMATGWAAYLIWARDDEAVSDKGAPSWPMIEAAVRDVGQWPRRVSWSGIYI